MKVSIILGVIIFDAWMAVGAVMGSVPIPFCLPLASVVTEKSKDGKGWLEQGVIGVTYVQAEGQFKSALAQNGWVFQHKVSLAEANSRALYTWKRGKQSVTLMLWRIDVGKTGFSWGVSAERK